MRGKSIPANCAKSRPVGKRKGGSRDDPELNSLRLLPSGPDRVGESAVRPTPAAHMAARRPQGKISGDGDLRPFVHEECAG